MSEKKRRDILFVTKLVKVAWKKQSVSSLRSTDAPNRSGWKGV
jgi:hypothetical protein